LSRTDIESFDDDDDDDDGHCVVANDDGWVVKKCAEKMNFVCEYEPCK
jgi:hypothetical protein